MEHIHLHPRGAYVGPALVSIALVVGLLVVLYAVRVPFSFGRDNGQNAAQPSGAANWVPSYANDVAPIFQRDCIRCHGPQRADKGLRLDSYQRTMAGDSYGTVVIPGDASLSAIVSVVKYGTMPHDGTKLTSVEITAISRWIDEGAREN